jgi:hypothetical protein
MAQLAGSFLRPLIEKACSRGADKTPDELIEACARPIGDSTRHQLWYFTKGKTPVGIAVTSIVLDFGNRQIGSRQIGIGDWGLGIGGAPHPKPETRTPNPYFPTADCRLPNADLPGERCVQVVVVGGHRANEWLKAIVKRGHAFHKAENAACLRFEGRKGWGRVLNLKPLGLTANGHWIFKDYDDGR